MSLFSMMMDGVRHLEDELATVREADAYVEKTSAQTLAGKDANDLVYVVSASRDYDPSGTLERIKAPLLAINFADDQLNPVELGVLDRAMARLPSAAAVLIPPGPDSAGHISFESADLWSSHLRSFLDATEAGA